MKKIEIKENGKTIIRFVPDNYIEPEKDIGQKDLTTSDAKYIGYSDIPEDKWDRIFKRNS